jgi:Polyketide cyclase / dehydrase and lipid transport
MREVTVSAIISAPREDVFDFVCDLAARPAYTDHFMGDYRLARVQPVGVGAAARFKLGAPLANEYAELTITKADRPRQIIEEIRVGRRGRNRSVAVYDFTRESAHVTRVELTTFSEPATIVDRFKEIGAAAWIRRQTRKSLDRLRMIFEEPERVELKRATIAGYEPDKAARFGAYAGMDPARRSRL